MIAKPFKPLIFTTEPRLMGVTFVDIDDENDVGQRIDNF